MKTNLTRHTRPSAVLLLVVATRHQVTEVYRVKLPGNPVIGEGKPENQNHAVIFTRGEYLQAIDMNQDGHFEEALKQRNLLEEFRREKGALPTTIVGFREHIFTGSVSSLANYMALQELTFVTLGQRVLDNPLRMRLHYGHPDLFDKLWFAQVGPVCLVWGLFVWFVPSSSPPLFLGLFFCVCRRRLHPPCSFRLLYT